MGEYYGVLGLSAGASDEEIRRAYRKLAMQWHPDKWNKTPALVGEAKQKFQQIQEAYSVLSDKSKRMMYDAGIYNRDDEDDDVEGYADFVQEMVSLMNAAKKEEKNYSIEELQSMFWEMAQDFEVNQWNNQVQQPPYESQWFCDPYSSLYESGSNSCEASMIQGDPHLSKSSFEAFGMHQFCT